MALYSVAGNNGLEGENTSSSGFCQRNRPGMFGSKDTYSVESQKFNRESFTSDLLKRNTRLPNCSTSPLALVKSRDTVLRLQEEKQIATAMVVAIIYLVRIKY